MTTSKTGFVSSVAGELFYELRGVISEDPLIAIHGGPGFTSHYLEPLFELSHLLPVICYDQAGCGRAKRAGPRKTFGVDSFVEELEALRQSLRVERMHLLGHSFGAAIAVEYALRNPSIVKSLMCACASLDIPMWLADAERLLSKLPLMSKMILREGVRSGNYSSPAFLQALALYYERHVYGMVDIPESIERSETEADVTTYQAVWGPNELVVNGWACDYTIRHRLRELICPVFYLCGRFDEATPEAHEQFAASTSGSKLHIFERSAHHPQITEREEFLAVTGGFIATASSQNEDQLLQRAIKKS